MQRQKYYYKDLETHKIIETLMPMGRLKSNVVEVNSTGTHKGTMITRKALGDVLMLFPALELWCKHRGNMQVAFETDDWLIDLASRQHFISQSFSFRDDMSFFDYEEKIELERTVDFVLIEKRKHRTLLFADLLFKIWSGIDEETHEYDPVDLKVSDYFHLTRQEMSEAVDLLHIHGWDGIRRLVVVAPMTKSDLRIWGKESEMIESFPDVNFVLLHNDILNIEYKPTNLINLSGRTDIMCAAAICANAHAAVVPDSGIMHICGVLGIPTIAIFGNVIPSQNRVTYYDSVEAIESSCPITDYCYDGQFKQCKNTPYYRDCMNEIPTSLINKKLEEIL